MDAERGIILTNRHVVEPGPVTAKAILLNSEELSLKPIYRDQSTILASISMIASDVHHD